MFFVNEGEIKTLPDKQKLRAFAATWNAEGSPAGQNERILYSNWKAYEEVKFLIRVNMWAIIKANIF